MEFKRHHRSYDTIKSKAHKLGLKSPFHWTTDEENILKQYYPIEGKQVVQRFKNRTWAAINCKVNELNLEHRRKSTFGWTESELEILRQWYPIEGSAVSKRFVNKSAQACSAYAISLGLRYTGKPKRAKRIICLETGEQYESCVELGNVIGISKDTISCTIRRGCACNGLHYRYINADGTYDTEIGFARGKNPKSCIRKSVLCLETNQKYESIADVKKQTGIDINHHLKGRAKSAGGYHWKYIDEEE